MVAFGYSFRPSLLGFLVMFLLCSIVSTGITSFTISKYEPLILQRKFGQIHKFQSNVKPTTMPNPRGFFVVNNHKMYVDFWAVGRRFQLTVNRGSPAFKDSVPLKGADIINNTSTSNTQHYQNLDFFSGYLNDNPHLETYGYISLTRRGEQTLVFTVNLGVDSLNIENSEYVVDNDYWFNTVAYLRSDVIIKRLDFTSPRFRTRHLLDESKQEVVDYYNTVQQYNYSIWHDREIKKEGKLCLTYLIGDYRVVKYFGNNHNVHQALKFSITMARFAYRKHDFDMDGILDNFSFGYLESIVFKDPKQKKDSIYSEFVDLFAIDKPTYNQWLETLNAWNHRDGVPFKFRPACLISGFTMGDSWDKDGVTIGGCCSNASTITDITRLRTVNNIALAFTHQLAYILGAKDDPEECTEANKNIKLGKYLSDPSLKTYENANNLHLSPCAMRDIHKTITDIVKKENCLNTTTDEGICGNKIREGEEECDCGDRFDCPKVDKCCIPAALSFDLVSCTIDKVTEHERRVGDNVIKYKYECSPKTHACCNEDCLKAKKEERKLCRNASECIGESYCNGDLTCPDTVKVDGFPCNNNTKVCVNGSCKVEICEFKESESCICENPNEKCFVCCAKSTGSSSTKCQPVLQNGEPVYKQNGTSCGSGGACVDGKCKEEPTTTETTELTTTESTTTETTELTTTESTTTETTELTTTESTTTETTELTTTESTTTETSTVKTTETSTIKTTETTEMKTETTEQVTEITELETDYPNPYTVPNPLEMGNFDHNDWYSEYWFLFLLATIILMILITLATAYYKKGYKAKKLSKFNDHVKTAQQRLEGNGRLQNASPETKMKASRLLALFPTAPQAVVIRTATRPGTEEAMVLKLLRNGYPMRRLTA